MNRDQNDDTKRTATKHARTSIRRVQIHLQQSHLHLGAKQESAGFVDVVTHPDSTLPMLNYVTPRTNTAWVSGTHIEQGLAILRAKQRIQRVRYADRLYPPLFGQSLQALNLQPESDTPVLVYDAAHHPRPTLQLPAHTTITRVNDQQGMGIWWYVWRNAYYDVMTGGVEPIFLGRDMRGLYTGYQTDLIMYQNQFPVGVARITRHKETAHLLALALMKEIRTPLLRRILVVAALDIALTDGATLVFIAGDASDTDDERARLHQLGFVDMGSIVSYAEPAASQRPADAALSQPVLVL